MQDKIVILIPNTTYHIYNRANGNERLFYEEGNFWYFLKKYKEYVSPIADTFCYCLMPNHFHFLIRIKNEEDLAKHFAGSNQTGFIIKEELIGLFDDLENFIHFHSSQFQKLEIEFN